VHVPVMVEGTADSPARKTGGVIIQPKKWLDCWWQSPKDDLSALPPPELIIDGSTLNKGDRRHLVDVTLPPGLSMRLQGGRHVNYCLVTVLGRRNMEAELEAEGQTP
jgi:hypothetical protein